jgi:hypothetical protein
MPVSAKQPLICYYDAGPQGPDPQFIDLTSKRGYGIKKGNILN